MIIEKSPHHILNLNKGKKLMYLKMVLKDTGS